MAANEAGRTKWTEETEDALVEWWQRYECLYNMSSDTFHKKPEKERCWEEIAAALHMPVEDVKVRAASLRTQYSRLLKPLRSGRKKRATTPRQQKILTSLKFLEKHIISRYSERELGTSAKELLTTQQESEDSEPENTALSPDLDSGRLNSPAESGASSRATWPMDKEDEFLELWQRHECLYNMSGDRFYDRIEKEKKWAEIARALDLPVEDVKMRATTLRTQYARLSRAQGQRRNKPMTHRQKRILKSCEFLRQHINYRSSEHRLDQSMTDESKAQKDGNNSEPENTVPPQDLYGGASPSPSQSSSVSPLPHKLPEKQPKIQNGNDVERQKVALLQQMIDVIQEIGRQPERDCEDSFGLTVAMELKRIQNLALRNTVKRQIMTTLYDALDSEMMIDPISYLIPDQEPEETFPRDESQSVTVVIP
ncbi:hypothetical protein D9C73_024357 [Collichthys lucidus]|uniref:MADF domain-containing protein n=1 Tax=Collichthys lucidus TaxID=240159 RepID=A0A4U5VP34_COLLU|nr:hypothetical protein D9C73_024357 [Collichthys lucidus]